MSKTPKHVVDDAALQALQRLLLDVKALGPASLRERLRWLEAVATAAEAVALDDAGRVGALHLRAALGAIVQWSQGPKDPDGLVALDALVRTLTTRGSLALMRSLASTYDELVAARAPQRAACVAARDALQALARSIEHGRPPPPALAARFVDLRASLPPTTTTTTTPNGTTTPDGTTTPNGTTTLRGTGPGIAGGSSRADR
jgi:hypothetical protein